MRPLMRELKAKLPGYAEFIKRSQAKLKSATTLAAMLMYNESMILLNEFCLKFGTKERRPVVPLHDGFLIRQSDIGIAQQIMSEILTDALALPLHKVLHEQFDLRAAGARRGAE